MPEIVQTLLAEYGLIIILAAITLEGFGIPTPGQSLLVAGAILSASGEFDIRLFLLLSWFAAIAGSMIGYLIGRFGGRKLLLRLPLNPSRIERMETICQRYGTLLVVFSRFIDGPRQLTGIIVGSLNMPAIIFFLGTSLGAFLWVGVWGLGGFYLGQHIHLIVETFDKFAPYTWIATGFMILAIIFYLIRWHKKHNHTSGNK